MGFVALCVVLVVAAEAAGVNCHGTPNTMPPLTDAPVLVSTVEDAQLFKVTSVVPNVLVAHIWGKPGRERCSGALFLSAATSHALAGAERTAGC